MATGGVFTIITNDGKQDRMLMATQLLNRRLHKIAQIRRRDPRISDPTPTLADIEKTHVLFMNAHFKPFAALGFEYNKVRPNSGTAQLGGDVTFSIPQFGDFFNDMALHLVLDVPTFTGTDGDDANSAYFRYCDFPGHRVPQRIQMEVNGNPLDEYTSDAYNFHYQTKVPTHKRTGWKRNVGQEVAKEAFLNQSVAGSQTHREGRIVFDGPQTPKPLANVTSLEMWVPLLFWFNIDPRLSIPSVSIPYGQRYIRVTLAPLNQMGTVINRGTSTMSLSSINISTCELYINNIFVNPEIHDIYIHRIGFTLIRVHRRQETNVNKSSDELLLQQLKWPIETLFVGLRPSSNVDYSTSAATRLAAMSNWWRYSSITDSEVSTFTPFTDGDGTIIGGASLGPDEAASTAGTIVVTAGGANTADITGLAEASITVKSCAATIDNLTISAHGVPIYNDIPSTFFNSYTPYTYGGYNLTTPDDCGVLVIPFNLYPGAYQPSGHINVSRAREFYFKYSSSVVNSSTTADLIVYASAINFLLISDGSAVLRYST